MTSFPSRLLSAALAALLTLGTSAAALTPELPDPGGDPGQDSAGLLQITVPDYTPQAGQVQLGDVSQIQAGKLYTLIVLPAETAAEGSVPKPLDVDLLHSGELLFMGTATASGDGAVTFKDIHLRTAEAAVYYVTGPGLTTPLAEATSLSVSAHGRVFHTIGGSQYNLTGATVSLVDKDTRYAYSNATQTFSTTDPEADNFSFSHLAPGTYLLHVEKPGYLPATSSAYIKINDGTEKFLDAFDLSPYLGDVNGDGERDLTDLTSLLSCYGKSLEDIPAPYVPDLYEDRQVNGADVVLLLNAMTTYGKFPAGTGIPAANTASITVKDTTPANKTDRTLTFALDNGGVSGLTFTAASISLTFRTDYIQPINSTGGAIYPGASNASATCLVPKSGVTVSDPVWSVDGDLATLTFSLSCAQPTALTGLVDFLYRPAPGKTDKNFFHGVFSVGHAAAQVGQVAVLTQDDFTLEYPQSAFLELGSLTIDPQPDSITIPSAGRTVVLVLSATGQRGTETYPSLSGVTWSLTESLSGVSISDNLLTITHAAPPGSLTLTASLGDRISAPLSITLENALSVPSRIAIQNADGDDIASASLSGAAGTALSASYQAEVADQYDAAMTGQAVVWSLSAAPKEVTVSENGVLAVASTLPAGTYHFTLHATAGTLRAAVDITLSLEAELDHLVLTGPSSAFIPTGSDPLVLSYTLTAIDRQDNVMSTGTLNPGFVVVSEDEAPIPGLTSDSDMNGNLTLTVTGEAPAGEYTLRASDSGLTTDLTLTLQEPSDPEVVPTHAAVSFQENNSGSPVGYVDAVHANLFYTGAYAHLKITPTLLTADGRPVTLNGERWDYGLDGLPQGVTSNISADAGRYLELAFDASLGGRTFFFTITATEETTGLSIELPVTVVIQRDIGLDLTVPSQLSIPLSGSLRYPLAVTGYYSKVGSDSPIYLDPSRLRWSVEGSGGKAPAGVSVENGVLTVTPAAKPGDVKITVYYREYGDDNSEAGVTATATVTLLPAASDPVLALLRDGELLSDPLDTAYGKEGTEVTLTYTPVLLDPATGETTELKDGVTWVGAQGSFTVSAGSEPGVYTTPITAIYNGQSVSLTSQITLYPAVSMIYFKFDEGDTNNAANAYRFPVPSRSAKTYHGTVMAQIRRGGKNQQVPLAQLGLADYDLSITTILTGVYIAYDRTTGRIALTVEPLASGNSMADPSSPELETRYLTVSFSYYPDGDPFSQRQSLRLTREDSRVATAILRQGSGSGSKFFFETIQGGVTLATAPGALSDCYALELIDQYGNVVTDQAVTWQLSGSPKSGSTDLVTLSDPGKAISENYPRYQSIRRLRISPDTPEGTYPLTLTASAAGFTRSLSITLEVSGQQELASLSLSGAQSAVIPKWYAKYNASDLNNDQRYLSYVASAQDPNQRELDASLCDFAWSVATASGKTPEGVKITPNKDNPSTATLSIDRFAKPTTSKDDKGNSVADPIHVTVTATPKGGSEAQTTFIPLTLTRSSLVPTLMRISGKTSFKLELEDSDVTEKYTFRLVDQYNQPVSDQDAHNVTWTLKGNPSYVSLTTKNVTDSNGYPAAILSIKNRGTASRATVTLTAAITFDGANTTSGKATVFQTLSIPITIGNGGGGNGGGNSGGTLTPGGEEQTPTPPMPSTTVTPSSNKSGTAGSITLSKEEVETLTTTTSTSNTLTIAPTNTSGLTSLTVTFPASLPKAIGDKTFNQSLRIQTALGTVTLPKEALRRLGSGGGNVSVSIVNQNGTVSVSFRSNGSTPASLPGQILFQAPVSGNTVLNQNNEVIKKAVVTNGQILTHVTGDTQFKIETRGKTFSDTQNSWAKSAVTFVTARELFQGTSETTFDPSGDMTRGMVVTVLHRLEDTPAANTANVFRDVPNNIWYTNGVLWANQQGIVQGSGDGFLPNDPVTREQLATILYRYMGQLGYSTTKRSSLSSFTDSSSVSSWAREAMEWAVASGLISGKGGGILDPGGKASRAEVATMLERLVRSMAPSV